MFTNLMLLLHLLAVAAWLGGMFFAHFCLRPAAAKLLAPPERLALMAAALGLFLGFMAVAVLTVVATGFAMFSTRGFRAAPIGWHIMLALGMVMAAVYAYIYGVCYRTLRTRCAAKAWGEGAIALNRIRQLVAINLVLGVLAVTAAVSAR